MDKFTRWCFDAKSSAAVTAAVMAAALVAALAMAAESPKFEPARDVELGSSADPRRPWNISRDEFYFEKQRQF